MIIYRLCNGSLKYRIVGLPLAIMDRKRRRLDHVEMLRSLARAGGSSSSGLSSIIAELQANAAIVTELPSHRSQASRALLEQFDAIKHTIDMPLLDGAGVFSWELLDPALLLAESIRRCPGMAEAYQQACTQRPPSPERPWSLVVAFDEFAPGNKLQVA